MPGLVDLKNRAADPFENSNAKAIVLLFVRTDCPISNRYAPEIERLYEMYCSRNVKFWLVYPDADTLPETIVEHLKEYRLSLPALRDPRHSLVKRAGVRATPEAAVFVAGGKEAYRGRIDNRYVDFGKERPGPTERDLEQALEAILNGKPVVHSRTLAIGCYIPEPTK